MRVALLCLAFSKYYLRSLRTEKAHDLNNELCDEVVHHAVLEYYAIPDAASHMGCLPARGSGHFRHGCLSHCVDFPRSVLPLRTKLPHAHH